MPDAAQRAGSHYRVSELHKGQQVWVQVDHHGNIRSGGINKK